MEEFESAIANLIRSRIRGIWPVGLIKCEAGEGVAGFTGTIESGLLRRTKQSAVEILSDVRKGESSFSDLLLKLREAARTRPDGPWYRCNIRLHGVRVSFQYFWESVSFSSVKEVESDLNGCVPSFVFERRFDRLLVPELTDFDVNHALFVHVPARVRAGETVTEPLLKIYATLEWQSDVNNGTMDQYFAREHDPMTSLPRRELYGRTYNGLLDIGHERAASVFSESLSLYAHFYPRVEAARSELGFRAVPRQEQSDIMDKYWKIERSLDPARVKYVREHIVELEQG
jgi:hypothetical protein